MTNITRVIVMSTCYTQTPPSNYGGIEQISYLTAKVLAERGIETWLVCSSDSPEPSEINADYNQIKTIPTGNSEESHYVACRDHILDKNQIPIDEGTVFIDHSHEKWIYMYSSGTAKAQSYVFTMKVESTGRQKMLDILLRDGIVTNYTYNEGPMPGSLNVR